MASDALDVSTQATAREAAPWLSRGRKDSIVTWLGMIFFLVIALFPIVVMAITSFKQGSDIIDVQTPPLWFHRLPTFSHYVYLFEQTKFLTWAWNTIVISFFTVVITLILAVPAAYALARLHFPNAENFGIGIFLTYLVPPALLFLPLTIILSRYVNLIDTKWALVVVYPTFTTPFCVWLLMGFFKTIPVEVEEAARVDGCSRLQAILRVVLPLSVPGLLTVAIFAFTLGMQEYIYALTFISNSLEKPVTIGVTSDLIRGDEYFWGELMAGALLAGIPVAILYNFFLDHFVEGISQGAIK
ncbi:MAG TPA: carbohydrate ABC transporter permease [Dehalococcoidia bacterium]|nr:carbohydrate ABC transporter permease [Dehalococcoidia bacterium]